MGRRPTRRLLGPTPHAALTGCATLAARAALTRCATLAARAALTRCATLAAGAALILCTALAGCASRPIAGASALSIAAPGGECVTTLNVVAHEDDDLLFVNPAVRGDIAAGRCVVTVFVTAGDAGLGPGYWRERERGPMAAYATMAGVPDAWTEGRLTLDGQAITRRRLTAARVTLLYLRLPDARDRPESLRSLWERQIPAVHALDSSAAYTRSSLIATLQSIMTVFRPSDIRTLDYEHGYDDGDHADHHTVSYLTFAAQIGYARPHRITAYMGYEMADLPPNLTNSVRDVKLTDFLAYAPHDPRVCQTAEACTRNFYEPRFARSYPTATSTSVGSPLDLGG